MQAPKDPRLLVRVCDDRGLGEWLAAHQAEALRMLVGATEPVAMYRAQAKYSFIEELFKQLEHAKTLR